MTPFFLSHHPPEHYGRCVKLGGLHLCARCLGTYPVMFAAIALQIALRAPKSLAWDSTIAFLLPLPALLDWARGRFEPSSGTNPIRLATGALLGAALGRTLYLHLRQPLHPLAVKQLLGLAIAAGVVEVLSRPFRLAEELRRPRPSEVDAELSNPADRPEDSAVEGIQPDPPAS